MEKSAEILYEKTAVNILSDRKNPNFEIWIVLTQYIFCWYQLLLKTGYSCQNLSLSMFLGCSYFFTKSEADVLREHCCLNFSLSQCFKTSPLAANSEWRGLWSRSIDTRFKKPHNPTPAPPQALTYTETWYTSRYTEAR